MFSEREKDKIIQSLLNDGVNMSHDCKVVSHDPHEYALCDLIATQNAVIHGSNRNIMVHTHIIFTW